MGVTSITGAILVKYKKGDKKKIMQSTGHIQFLRINCKNHLDTIIGEHQSAAIKNIMTLL